MKTLLCHFIALTCLSSLASTTINSTNCFAYGSNIGWINCAADTANGAVIGEYVCSGYFYAANVGWINLGSGAPANGIYYQNGSANDFGVNQDGLGNLRGFAYGANIGWVNFESTGGAKVDLSTGRFSGYAYSANCGWISLSNAMAFVKTDSIRPGVDSTGDGIPDAWALQNFGTTSISPGADPDHDGVSNLQEYEAGTDPNNASSVFKIISETKSGTNVTLVWNTVPSRDYQILKSPSLAPTAWTDSGLGNILPSSSSTGTNFVASGTNMFFRILAIRPLMQ